MIPLKDDNQIRIMAEGGQILAGVLKKTLGSVKPGISKAELDKIAEEEIVEKGGEPSFKMVRGYHWTSCITVNSEVVHGIPNDYKIRPGDIVGIDLGIYYKGFHTDVSWSILVPGGPKKDELEKKKFLQAGEEALTAAIKKALVGNYIGQISQEIQNRIEAAGYHVVRELTGHGVGKVLHEDPSIPGYLDQNYQKTTKIQSGMVLAIEIIYTLGKPDIVLEADGWTITTKDGKISALFEGTVAVGPSGPLILTKL
jgi:methionyl aminopeptidase